MSKNIKNYDDKFINIFDNQQQIINKLMELNDKQMD